MENGNAALDKGDFSLAQQYFKHGLANIKNKTELEIVSYWYSYCNLNLGLYHKAIRDFQTNLENLELLQGQEYPYEYWLYYNLADAYDKLEQWVNVKAMLEKVMQTQYARDHPHNYHSCVWFLGDAYRGKGDYEQASQHYEKAKKYFEMEKDAVSLFSVSDDIAQLLLKEGKVQEALQLIQTTWSQVKASEEYEDVGTRLATSLGKIAISAIEMGTDTSENLFAMAEPILREHLSQMDVTEEVHEKLAILALLSKLSSLAGQKAIYAQTEDYLNEFSTNEKLSTGLVRLSDFLNLVQITLDLADYYYAQTSTPGPNPLNFKILHLYKQVDQYIDEAVIRMQTPETRREFHAQYLNVAFRIFALYQRIYQDFWEDFLYESLGILEKYKGFEIFISMEQSGVTKPFRDQLNPLGYEISLKKRRLALETDPQKKQHMLQELDELEGKYYNLENEMIIKSDVGGVKIPKDPVKLMEETLKELWPLMEYFRYGILYFALDENVLYIIAFTKDQVHRSVIEFDKKKFANIQELLIVLREQAANAQNEEDLRQLNKILQVLSKMVSKSVMQPELVQILRNLEYLTIIPSGFFINFPLEILQIEGEYFGTKFKMSREFNLKFLTRQIEKVQYLLRNHRACDKLVQPKEVVFVSNPNFLECMVPEKSVIDPYIVRQEMTVESPEELKLRSDKGEEVYLAGDCVNMDLGETEVQQVLQIFQEKHVPFNALIHEQVTREKMLDLFSPQIKLFHFAGHALFDNDNPQYSKLLLRGGQVLVPPDFQKITFDLNPLFIFSACESGVSKVQKGDEPFGFLRFVKVMEAQNVIFSLWPVLSSPTTQLMIGFYENLLAGAEIAEALRKARANLIQLMEKEEKDLGFYKEFSLLCWSPFSFIGLPFFFYQFPKEVKQ